MFYENILNPLINILGSYSSRNAFCIDETFYTYNDFAKSISKIRKALKNSKPNNTIIGLMANDDIETYASIFAIWLEGYTYVPLHPQQPSERSMEIIKQAKIDLVISSINRNTSPAVKTIVSTDLEFKESILRPKKVDDSTIAYILFTSGSTGKPKGVPITRGNLGAFMKAFWEVGFLIDHNDRCLQSFDLTFDVSVQSFLVPLTKGACTYTIPHSQIKYSYIYGLFDEHKLTFGAMAPSMIRYLQPYFNEILIPSMRYNIITAEASPVELISEWSKCIPNAEIYDFYGPTEATIYCTYYKFNREYPNKDFYGILSIGKTMSGIKAVIVDNGNNILDANQKGELCISGNQLTQGYWSNPAKNNEVFLNLKIDGVFSRFYKTGDLCVVDDDGDILYSGRSDSQVKIQGYRVELGEIEFHARTYLKRNNAIVLTFINCSGNTELALFIEAKEFNTSRLIDYLKSKMPHYMIPSKLIFKEKFPVNTNGKTDKFKLQENL